MELSPREQIVDIFFPPRLVKYGRQVYVSKHGFEYEGWTNIHFLFGVLAGLTKMTFKTATILHVLWELSEYVLSKVPDKLFQTVFKETWKDIILDTIAFSIGFLLIRSYRSVTSWT